MSDGQSRARHRRCTIRDYDVATSCSFFRWIQIGCCACLKRFRAQSTPARFASRNTARCTSPPEFSGDKSGRSLRGSREQHRSCSPFVSHNASNESCVARFLCNTHSNVSSKQRCASSCHGIHFSGPAVFAAPVPVLEYIAPAPAVSYTVLAPLRLAAPLWEHLMEDQ